MKFMEVFEWYARRQEYKTAPEARRGDIILTTGLLAAPFIAFASGFLIIEMMTAKIPIDCQEGDIAMARGVATHFDRSTSRTMLSGRIEVNRPRPGRDDFPIAVENFEVPWGTGKIHAKLIGECLEGGDEYLNLTGKDFQTLPSH